MTPIGYSEDEEMDRLQPTNTAAGQRERVACTCARPTSSAPSTHHPACPYRLARIDIRHLLRDESLVSRDELSAVMSGFYDRVTESDDLNSALTQQAVKEVIRCIARQEHEFAIQHATDAVDVARAAFKEAQERLESLHRNAPAEVVDWPNSGLTNAAERTVTLHNEHSATLR